MKRAVLLILFTMASVTAAVFFWHSFRQLFSINHSSQAMLSEREWEGKEESEESPIDSAFLDWRLSYPTGHFEAAWYTEARPRHEQMQKRLPGGARKWNKSLGVLDPTRVTFLGPAPLDAAPAYHFGRVGGRVNTIAVHPTQPNMAWFGSDGGGVWKTANCCGPDTVWEPKTDQADILNIAIGVLALDPNNPDVIYAGTGDFRRSRRSTFGASGLLKSTDGGESWQVLGTEVFNPVYSQAAGGFPQYRAISTVVVDKYDSNRLAIGTNQGIYFSYDAGEHWDGPCYTNGFTTQRQSTSDLLAIDTGSSIDLVAAIGSEWSNSPIRPDLRYSGANGVYRTAMPSSGCPASWQLISREDNGWPAGSGSGIPRTSGIPNPQANMLERIDLAVAPSDPNIIYAQVMPPSGGDQTQSGVWRTLDGGVTWIHTAVQPNDFVAGCGSSPAYERGLSLQSYNAGMAVNPTNPQTVFLSSTDIWRSTDGGDTFINLTCAYVRDEEATVGQIVVHPDQHARAFVGGDPQRLLIGNDGGVYYTENALAETPVFIPINGGVGTIEFFAGDITANFNDPAVLVRGIAGAAQDNGGSNYIWPAGIMPGPAVWSTRTPGDGVAAMVEPILGQRWYYSAQAGELFASIAGPNSPADLVRDPNQFPPYQLDFRKAFLFPFTLYKFGGEDTCPAKTGCQHMLAGTHRVWESLSGGFPYTAWYPNSPDLTKATANGALELNIINKTRHAYSDPSIAVVGTNDGNVAYGFGLGQGIDNSATWVNVTNGNAVLPNRPVMDVVTDPLIPTTAYVALAGFDQNTPTTPGHVYRVICNADCSAFNWENKSGNLPNIPVNALIVNPRQLAKASSGTRAFAGTDWGLYYTDDINAATPVWYRFDAPGLPSAMIWNLVIDRGATTLAIFTRSRGAYAWPLSALDLIFKNGFE